MKPELAEQLGTHYNQVIDAVDKIMELSVPLAATMIAVGKEKDMGDAIERAYKTVKRKRNEFMNSAAEEILEG